MADQHGVCQSATTSRDTNLVNIVEEPLSFCVVPNASCIQNASTSPSRWISRLSKPYILVWSPGLWAGVPSLNDCGLKWPSTILPSYPQNTTHLEFSSWLREADPHLQIPNSDGVPLSTVHTRSHYTTFNMRWIIKWSGCPKNLTVMSSVTLDKRGKMWLPAELGTALSGSTALCIFILVYYAPLLSVLALLLRRNQHRIRVMVLLRSCSMQNPYWPAEWPGLDSAFLRRPVSERKPHPVISIINRTGFDDYLSATKAELDFLVHY